MHNVQFCPGCLRDTEFENGVCAKCGFDMNGYTVMPHHLVPGTLVKQRYKIGRVLGEGGFGITYIGIDTVLNLKVAIKEFYMSGYVNRNHDASPNVFATLGTHRDTFEKNREKFLNEARVLAQFYGEAGIVGVRDFCEENGTAYIIMDFLNGVDLKTYLEQKGRLAPEEAVKLLMPVMTSLQHVHAEGIIHRDISPDNIMVMEDGSTKLLDFGAAREISQTDIKSLSVILKPGYAPEEQYRSKGRQGPWTDVYALAATLYKCIVGATPDDAMERMYRDRLPSPAAADAACPIAISNVIIKGLAVRQADRYQDVASFLADLKTAMEDPDNAELAPDTREIAPAQERGVIADDQTVLADTTTIYTPNAAKEHKAPKPAAQPSAPAAKTKLKTAKPEPAESAEKPAAKKKPEGKPVSKKPANKKGIIIIAAVAAVVIIAAVAIAAFGNANTNVSAGMMSASLEETASLRTFTLNGVTLELPAPVQTLLDKGWVFEDAQYDTATIEAGGSKSSVMLMNEYGKIELRLSNTTLNEQPASACTITAVSADEHILNDNYLGANGNEFKTANGITLGASSAEDVKTAYPSAKKDGSYLKLETPYADIRFYNYDNNPVSGIYIRLDMTKDCWDDTSNVSSAVPAEYDDSEFINAYTLPDFAVESTVLSAKLSMTVQDMVDAGWTIERQPDYIPANSYAEIYLRLDVRTTAVVEAVNYTRNAILPQYGIVIASFEDSNMSGAIHTDDLKLLYKGDVLAQIGVSTYSDVINALKAAGLTYTEDDGSIALTPYSKEQKIMLRFTNADNVLWRTYVSTPYDINKFYYEQENANQ